MSINATRMSYSPVNTTQHVSFKGAEETKQTQGLLQVNLERAPETDTFTTSNKTIEEPKASTAKKWGVGIASFLLPGLGQAINGEWGKAVGTFAGCAGCAIIGGLFPPAALVGLGVGIWSIVDAVKNAKA